MLLPLGEDSSCYVGEWSLPLIFSLIVFIPKSDEIMQLWHGYFYASPCFEDSCLVYQYVLVSRMTTQLSGRFQGWRWDDSGALSIRTGDSRFRTTFISHVLQRKVYKQNSQRPRSWTIVFCRQIWITSVHWMLWHSAQLLVYFISQARMNHLRLSIYSNSGHRLILITHSCMMLYGFTATMAT